MLRLLIENTLDREERIMAEWQRVRLGNIIKTNQNIYSTKENYCLSQYLVEFYHPRTLAHSQSFFVYPIQYPESRTA